MLANLYWRLLLFLRPYMKQVVFVWVIVAAAAAFTMVQPKLLEWAVDAGLEPSPSTRLRTAIDSSTTDLPVLRPDQLEAGETYRIDNEKVRVVTVGETTVSVDRGVDGTTVAAHDARDTVQAFGGKTSTLLVAAVAIIAAAALRGFFTYWQTFLGEWLGQHVAFDLRNMIYEKLQRLSYAYHDKQQTGQLMSRATQDVEATRMFIQMGALRLLDMALRIS
ncbi:MAG TPA: ABC transporter transmembrane domain-containing protein, partial [Dehalococcoidia bacterium]|nr:ABC transporter transmembrane domain-containing protein [Dehalococcoidia bacterium]